MPLHNLGTRFVITFFGILQLEKLDWASIWGIGEIMDGLIYSLTKSYVRSRYRGLRFETRSRTVYMYPLEHAQVVD